MLLVNFILIFLFTIISNLTFKLIYFKENTCNSFLSICMFILKNN